MQSLLRPKEGPPKVLVFDWDDTICPSSFLDRVKCEKITQLPKHVSSSKYKSLCTVHRSQEPLIHHNLSNMVYLFVNEISAPVKPAFWFTWSFNHLLTLCSPVISQIQKLFTEISRLSARMLHEASKYGEVSWKICSIISCSKGFGHGEVRWLEILGALFWPLSR